MPKESSDKKSKSFNLKAQNAEKIEDLTLKRKKDKKRFVSESEVVDEMVEDFDGSQ